MMFMKSFLLFVEVATCILLVAVILLQKTKGGGMSAIGGGVGEALFGAQMGNVLTKTTVILGVIFLVNTTVLALLEVNKKDTPRIGDGTPAVQQPQPGMPAGGQQQPMPLDSVPDTAIPDQPPSDGGAVVPEPIDLGGETPSSTPAESAPETPEAPAAPEKEAE